MNQKKKLPPLNFYEKLYMFSLVPSLEGYTNILNSQIILDFPESKNIHVLYLSLFRIFI